MTRMLKHFFTGVILLACALVAGAQTTLITASHISYFGGTTVTGQMCLTPTNGAGTPINIVTPLGQQLSPQSPLCFNITAGVLQAGANVPDTSQTQPLNACYSIAIKNFRGDQMALFPCVQPSGSTWSFDAYVPNGTVAIPSYTAPQFQVNGVPNPLQSIVDFVGSGVSYGAGGAINIATGGSSTSGTTVFSPIVLRPGRVILLVRNQPIVME